MDGRESDAAPERWRATLRGARDGARLTRRALAEKAALSEHTIASYETGRRPPTRPTLTRLGEALRLTDSAAEALLAEAGFHHEPPNPVLDELAGRRPAPSSLAAVIGGYTWPCLALNDRFEILEWNAAAARVAEFELAPATPARRRNMMYLAAEPHFRKRMMNWEEATRYLLGLVKRDIPSLARAGDFDAYFAAVVQEINHDHPEALPDLMRLWMSAPPLTTHRNIYYPEWRTADGAVLRFNTVVSAWSDFDALYVNDWRPADAQTWDWLARHAGVAQSEALTPPEPPGTWHALLRQARTNAGLSRARLAHLAGLHPRALDNWEAGRRIPERPLLLRLLRRCTIDGATANAVLAAAGYELEPSDWSLFLAGEPPRTMPDHYQATTAPPASIAALSREIDAHPWPCLVIDSACRVTDANAAAARVFHAPDWVAGDLHGQSLLRLVLSKETRDQFLNWDEVVTTLVPATLQRDQEGRARSTLPEAIHRLALEEPALVRRLEALWQAAPSSVLQSRVVFPVRWREAGGAHLSFDAMLLPALGHGAPWLLDWRPADAPTWNWLKRR